MPGLDLRKLSLRKRNPSEQSLSSLARNASNHLLNDVINNPQALQVGAQIGPIANVAKVLAENTDRSLPPIFCELLQLRGQTLAGDLDEELAPNWRQIGRWIRYEQAVEGSGTRFSKPVLSLLQFCPLLQVRNLLKRGLVLLDYELEKNTVGELFDGVIKSWNECGMLPEERSNYVKMILSAPKMHLVHGRLRTSNELHHSVDHKKIPENANGSNDEQNGNPEDADEHLLRKLPTGTESAVVMVASEINGLDRPLSVFIRLQHPQTFYPDLPDHAVPVRFVFVLLNPQGEMETLKIGRTVSTLLSDEIFHIVANYANDRFTLADCIEELLGQSTIIPPSQCSPETTRLHPEDVQIDRELLSKRRQGLTTTETDNSGSEDAHTVGIAVSGRLFGGLIDDVKRKLPFYVSDFTDYFRGRFSQSISSTICCLIWNITNVITFSAVMERLLGGEIGAVENILCCAISGIVFGLFAGQPLNILSATGPTLLFEAIIYDICKTQQWEFLPFRFWMGMWISFILMIIVAKDYSALVAFITRFTEEAFATLISVVFIIQALERVYAIRRVAPLIEDPIEFLREPYCRCDLANKSRLLAPNEMATELAKCRELGGNPTGFACHFKPDIFLFSILIFIGTFVLAMKLHSFKQSPFFSSRIRNFVSDFGVLISIVVFTILSQFVGLKDMPGLQVPDHLTPTIERSWIVDFTNIPHVYVAFLAGVPAIFYSVLIVMDQQITAVIVNRSDNLLKKSSGYHLDLAVVALLVLICSFMGLPFFVAATVLSVAHIDSLKLHSDVATLGEEPSFHGVKEQRLTVIISHILIGLSLFFTRIIRLVPMPVLAGIFLYLGVISLSGTQFIQRLLLLLMPVKYQPEYRWLRPVKMRRAHLFTFIQLLSILALFGLKSMDSLKITFPLMLVIMVILRAWPIERFFTYTELLALDDRLPRWSEVMKPSKKSRDSGTSILSQNQEETELTKS
ncbi:Anion exchange protein [Aphelenchoides besseyi]|nr:Anion exchange protein [Aphelenchoides besseyi]